MCLANVIQGLSLERDPNVKIQFPYQVYVPLANKTFVRYTAGIDMTLKDLVYYEAESSYYKVNGTMKLYNRKEEKWIADLGDDFAHIMFNFETMEEWGEPDFYLSELEELETIYVTRDEVWDWYLKEHLPARERELATKNIVPDGFTCYCTCEFLYQGVS